MPARMASSETLTPILPLCFPPLDTQNLSNADIPLDVTTAGPEAHEEGTERHPDDGDESPSSGVHISRDGHYAA
jgi:hypothetical protein